MITFNIQDMNDYHERLSQYIIFFIDHNFTSFAVLLDLKKYILIFSYLIEELLK